MFDEKRQKINVGDSIIFSKQPDLTDQLTVQVTQLSRFPTFDGLVSHFSMTSFGYPETYSKQAFLDSIYKIYTREEEQKYGILAIGIKLI